MSLESAWSAGGTNTSATATSAKHRTAAMRKTGPTPSDWRRVAGVYGGLVGSWTYASPLSPRDQMQDNEFNTEHVWPRSRDR